MISRSQLEYKYVARLRGHTESIQALSVNKDKTILASGGKVAMSMKRGISC
jgi:hypothetical protein